MVWFFGLAEGVVLKVLVTHASYEDASRDITIGAFTTTHNFYLTPKPVVVAPAAEGSLLGWIWDSIVAFFRPLIDSALSTLRSWINGLIAAANAFAQNLVNGAVSAWNAARAAIWDALNRLDSAWDNFTTRTLPNIWAAIQEGANNLVSALENAKATIWDVLGPLRSAWDNFTTKTLPDLRKGIQETANDLVKGLEGLSNSMVEKINNSASTTREWAMGYITVSIPAYIESTVPDIVRGLFDRLIEYWAQRVTESFSEGLEEGLKEAEAS